MALPGRHALIIEDEVLVAWQIEDELRELGYETFAIAESPRMALAQATAQRPDVIVSDYRIVGGTGVEAVTAVLAELGRVPVLFVTGNRAAVEAQVSFPVVEKPFSHLTFKTAWNQACEGVGF